MTCLTRPASNSRVCWITGAIGSRPSPSSSGTRTAGSPPGVVPTRTPSRRTTRVVWMFSPMTMNGGVGDAVKADLRWAAGVIGSGGDGDEPTAVDEQLEEVVLGLELDVLDPADECLERVAVRPGQQQGGGAVERGVADALDPLRWHGREQADGHGIADIDRVGESPRKVDPLDLVGGDPQAAQQDALSDRVGRLGLGEQTGVGAREADALVGRDEHLVEAVVEPTLRVHPLAPAHLGQDVDEARAADPGRLA